MQRRVFSVFLLAAVALVVTTLLAWPASGATGLLDGVKVCLDPGHGGSDPGAVNEVFGLLEKDINLDVSLALRSMLMSDGAAVVMTRNEDKYLDNRDRYTFCNDQQASILVSVHTNSSTNIEMDGALGLYFKAEDKILAGAIYNVMLDQLGSTKPEEVVEFTAFGLSRFASGVLLKSDMPATIAEPLFMSNPHEALELQVVIPGNCDGPSIRRCQIAQAIHDGVVAYFGQPEPTPTPTPDPGGAMHVAAIDMWYGQRGPNYVVYTRVTIVDEADVPVPGATVSLTTSLLDGSGVDLVFTTDSEGQGVASFRSRQSGTYVSEVTDVVKDGWTYDVDSNVKTSETLPVP